MNLNRTTAHEALCDLCRSASGNTEIVASQLSSRPMTLEFNERERNGLKHGNASMI